MVRGILSTSACQDCVNNDHQIVNLPIPRLSPPPFVFLIDILYWIYIGPVKIFINHAFGFEIRWRMIIREDATGKPRRDDI